MRKIMDITKKLFVVAGLAYAAMMVTGCSPGNNLFVDTLKSVGGGTTLPSSKQPYPPASQTDSQTMIDTRKYWNDGSFTPSDLVNTNVSQIPLVGSTLANKNLWPNGAVLTCNATAIPGCGGGMKAGPEVGYSNNKGASATIPIVGINNKGQTTGPILSTAVGINKNGVYGDVSAGYNLPGKLPSVIVGTQVGVSGQGTKGYIGVGGNVNVGGNTIPVYAGTNGVNVGLPIKL